MVSIAKKQMPVFYFYFYLYIFIKGLREMHLLNCKKQYCNKINNIILL